MRGFFPRVAAVAVACALSLPAVASADLINVYVAGKAEYVDGTSDLFKSFDASMGYGVEAGIELLGIDLWGDIMIMGSDQYMGTVNTGFDLTVGDDVRFTLGLYPGLMAFRIPDAGSASGLNFNRLSQSTLNDLDDALGAVGSSRSDLEAQFNQYSDQFDTASDWALGATARARLALDFKLAPTLYLGFQGTAGYHYIVSGEDAAGQAKSSAIDSYANTSEGEQLAERGLIDAIRTAAGAEDLDTDDLDGMNYQIGVYLKFDLGT